MTYVEMTLVEFEASQIQAIVENVNNYQWQSITELMASVYDATVDSISQKTMEYAADILAQAPGLTLI